jgi:hypothetical protein
MSGGVRRVQGVMLAAQSWVVEQWRVGAEEETSPCLTHDEMADVLAEVNSLVDRRWLG